MHEPLQQMIGGPAPRDVPTDAQPKQTAGRCPPQASVEMMSPKSDAGLSSGPALAGFGAFGQQAGDPSSAPVASGTAAAFNAGGTAFSGVSSFAAPGATMFGSMDSRSAGASAGGRLITACARARQARQHLACCRCWP